MGNSFALKLAKERNPRRFVLQLHTDWRAGRMAESQMSFHTIDFLLSEPGFLEHGKGQLVFENNTKGRALNQRSGVKLTPAG